MTQPGHPPWTRRIQVISDLHLELGDQYTTFTFPPSAPLLLLSGDVGCLLDYDEYLTFLACQTSRFDTVFLVLGNHEFYGADYDAGVDRARKICAEPALEGKVVLLHRERWDDPDSGLTILGCTLWSAIPEAAYEAVAGKVKDYKNIAGWTPTKHNALHEEEAAWLRGQVAEARSQERQILVATHHAPCLEGTSKPEHSTNPWTNAFATDLIDDEDAWRGVRIWVFGHTHYSTEFVRKGITVLANQRGYVFPGKDPQKDENRKREKKAHEFDPELVVEMSSGSQAG